MKIIFQKNFSKLKVRGKNFEKIVAKNLREKNYGGKKLVEVENKKCVESAGQKFFCVENFIAKNFFTATDNTKFEVKIAEKFSAMLKYNYEVQEKMQCDRKYFSDV